MRPPQFLRHCLFALLSIALVATGMARAQPPAPVLLILGDSVSAGYGLPPDTGWVTLLAAQLAAQKSPYRVVNASISGDTTAGGRSRLPALLAKHRPAIVVIELGGNDGLRGGNLATTRANLDALVTTAQAAGAKVLLVGMRLPPNYGPTYTNGFAAMYAELAKAHKTALVPFLFEGFGDDERWFQPDRIHPTREAQAKLLDNVWPVLGPLLGNGRRP